MWPSTAASGCAGAAAAPPADRRRPSQSARPPLAAAGPTVQQHAPWLLRTWFGGDRHARSEVEDLDGGYHVFVGPAPAAAGGHAARGTAFRRGAAEHGRVVDVAEAGRSGGDRAGLADLRRGPAPSRIAGHR